MADALPTPESSRPLVDREVLAVAQRVVALRPWAAPLVAGVAGLAAWLDPQPWRVALLGTVAVGALAASLATAWHARRHGVASWAVPANLVGMSMFQLALLAGTGGIDSPLLPVLVPLAMFGSVLIGRPAGVAIVLTVQVTAILALAALQASGRLGHLPIPAVAGDPPVVRSPEALWLGALVLCLVLTVSSAVGTLARRTLEGIVARAVHARSEQLRVFTAYTRDLEALGAEIAHELKNPLASVKGLSTLLVKDVPEGRPAQRLGVLRDEVERMRSILDEFLAFTRPIAPLSFDVVDAGELCAHVVELHEGIAAAREVRLVVAGRSARLRGDRRRLVQVLVNLVQNALDAAPRGSELVLDVFAEGAGVRVDVLDRGPGLAPDLGARAFEAGVTTKPHGSGLGLPIARAIARQHGGELELLPRPGGGTVARLRLPAAGPPEEVP